MADPNPRIAYLAAGAAGMICGSCLRDNALVTALTRMGIDATLIPTYTPIRTDEADRSLDRVFYGGVNVYLQQRVPVFRYLPGFMDRWLNAPWLIRLVARDNATPSPQVLGELTLSMLRGTEGNQRKEVARLADWLANSLRPDLINFTNILIAGSAAALKQRLGVPLVVTLQGDDVFLDSLPEKYRRQAIQEIRRVAQHVDAFIVFNQFYADYMQQYLGLPTNRFHRVPLGINLDDYRTLDPTTHHPAARPLTIGYFARLAPEKGLHLLVDAYLALRRNPDAPPARLLIAGWLGREQRDYAEQQFRKLTAAGYEADFEYRGEVDRGGKLQFLSEIDVLSVPTVFQEAKGLYVLEALAAGVPVVLPAHGAFPELVASTAGGVLCPPHDVAALAETLRQLLVDPDRRRKLGLTGRAAVFERHSAEVMARETLTLYRHLIARD